MIVRPRPTFLAILLQWRGSVIHRVWPQVLGVSLMSAAIVYAHRHAPGLIGGVSVAPFSLIGIALSIFLGFRNSACYDRWWEARKQWGMVVVAGRDLARQSHLLGPEDRAWLLMSIAGHARVFARHLRPGALPGPLPAELDGIGLETTRNPPVRVLAEVGRRLARIKAEGRISDVDYSVLDRSLALLSATQAACERIRNTPVPYGYMLLLHRTAYLYCFAVPFAFADLMGWWTPFAAALLAYTFFGLDALGDELEVPFGTSPNALPIEALAQVIEIEMREALGETDLPPNPMPRDFLLF